MKTLIYDIEIENCIPDRNSPPVEGITYCDGWNDLKGMGISVIGYQWCDEKPEHYRTADDFLNLLHYLDDEDYVLIGFNSRSFDDKLLQAHGLEGVQTHYDLLEQVRIAAGFGTDFRSVRRGFSYKLDTIAKANGMAKSGSGELAPVLWQQGQEQAVVDYCLHDVAITKAMLDLGLAGKLVDPNTGDLLKLAPLQSVK
jgi:hypothetical protein